MTFLNAALLGGALAFVVPLLIHLLNRNRFNTVQWGAMHLLDSVVQTNRRRLRLDQLLLLLVRCAIPVVLALCLAKPVLTKFRAMLGDAPVAMVVLLDDSYSMDVADGEGTRFDLAVAATRQIIDAAPQGSELAVLLTGGRPTPLTDQPVFDAELIDERLGELTAGSGSSDLVASLDEAAALLAGMSLPTRELVVISDFQPADLTAFRNGNAADVLRSQLDSLDVPVSLTLLPIGREVRDNVAIEEVRTPPRPLAVGQRLDLRAVIRNFGDAEVSQLPVTLQIDDTRPEPRRVNIAPGASTQVLFRPTFEQAGTHRLSLTLQAGDSLAADDRYDEVVTVWDRLPVLLVDGSPGRGPLEGETDYLAIALTPLSLTSSKLTDLIETRTVAASDLTDDVLRDSRLVVLANVARLNEETVDRLETFVTSGGSLLISAGDRIDTDWANDTLGPRGLLPANWGERVEDETRIAITRFDHPAITVFNDASYGDLSTATFKQRLRTTKLEDAATVVLSLNTGEPLLIERPHGSGTVMQLTTAIDADWSDLPQRPLFVPLAQELVANLATRITPPRNVAAGQPLVAVYDVPKEQIAVRGPGVASATIAAQPRDEDATDHVARFEQTQRPGFYTFNISNEEPRLFAVRPDRRESRPALLSTQQQEALAEQTGATLVASAENYLARDRERRRGREIWTWMLAALLVLMVGEVLLQQWIVRRPA